MRLLNLFGASGGAGFMAERRQAMVQRQLRDRGVRSAEVLDAMLAVPRHEFVPPALRDAAYSDQPLPLGSGQTISQPLIVALMTEALALARTDRVLEIGTGSGYQTAVLSRLAGEVFSVECRPELATAAWIRFQQIGYGNIRARQGDGGLGWPEAAPFHKILITAAAAEPPPPLIEQLADGGRLIVPVGNSPRQELILIEKRRGQVEQRRIAWCRFVPLVGIHGYGRLLAG